MHLRSRTARLHAAVSGLALLFPSYAPLAQAPARTAADRAGMSRVRLDRLAAALDGTHGGDDLVLPAGTAARLTYFDAAIAYRYLCPRR